MEKRKFVIDNNLMELYVRNFCISILPYVNAYIVALLQKQKKPKGEKGTRNKEQEAEEKALRKSMQKFMQAHNREQHDQFIEGLLGKVCSYSMNN